MVSGCLHGDTAQLQSSIQKGHVSIKQKAKFWKELVGEVFSGICMDQRNNIGYYKAFDPLNLGLGLVQKLLQTGTGHLLKVAGGSQAEEMPQGA